MQVGMAYSDGFTNQSAPYFSDPSPNLHIEKQTTRPVCPSLSPQADKSRRLACLFIPVFATNRSRTWRVVGLASGPVVHYKNFRKRDRWGTSLRNWRDDKRYVRSVGWWACMQLETVDGREFCRYIKRLVSAMPLSCVARDLPGSIVVRPSRNWKQCQ